MVNVSIRSKYNTTIGLVTRTTDCPDTTTLYSSFCATLFMFHPHNHTSNQSKKSGVKYVRINVHPTG